MYDLYLLGQAWSHGVIPWALDLAKVSDET